jgi:HSP20 family protein
MFGSLYSSFDSNLVDNIRRMESELDQLVGRGAYPAGIRAVPRGTFPPINLGSTPDKVEVYLFAAGVDPKTIDVSIQQNLLTVSGNRKAVVNPQAEYYRRERFDGEFRRVIALPDDADPDRVEAKYRDGVLQITVQRRQAARPRQVEVK